MCYIYVALARHHKTERAESLREGFLGLGSGLTSLVRWTRGRSPVLAMCGNSLLCLHCITATEMAALRRLFLALNKPVRFNFTSLPRNNRFEAQTLKKTNVLKSIAVGICIATGGAVAYYCYQEMYNDRRRTGCRLNRGVLLPSLPAVSAKEKVTVNVVCCVCNNSSLCHPSLHFSPSRHTDASPVLCIV